MDQHELYELEQMREQLNLLNQKLDNQRIFNQRVMVESVNKDLQKLNRSGRFYIVASVFALLYCPIVFSRMGFSAEFVWGTVAMLAVCLGYTMYLHHGLNSADVTRGNLVELSQRVLRLRKGYSSWLYIGFSLVVVWFYFFYREAQMYAEDEVVMIGAIIGGVIGGIFGLKRHFQVVREADSLLAHIDDLQNDRE